MSLQTDVHRLVLERLGRVSVAARQAVESVLAGSHRSVRRGLSVEFAGHRPYQPGDDLRRLDWQVWARTDRFDVRLFEEETRLRCTLVVDASGSMAYRGEGRRPKLDHARTIAAALAFLLVRAGDAAGLAIADGGLRERVPAGSTMGHLLRLLERLEDAPAEGPTDLARVLVRLAAELPPRGVVFAITDGCEEPGALGAALRLLRARRQDVRLLLIEDPDESSFPFSGGVEFHGLESEPRLRLDADRVRSLYREAIASHRAAIVAACRGAGVQIERVSTDGDPALQLLGILAAATAGSRG